MRDLDPGLEKAFYDLVSPYFDLERDTGRRYPEGQYSLQRMAPLAAALGHPERDVDVVHVAGTKGKGSTCHFLASLLQSAGVSCGLFTSPHLVTVRERFQMNGRLIAYDALLDLTQRCAARFAVAGLVPTLFEFMTVMALRWFADCRAGIAVMETGIGGRLDATNYVPAPRCCVITPISFDHMQLLGNTIPEIAAEKAGIIKPGVPVVISRQPYPEAEAVLCRRAAELAAPVLVPLPDAAVEALPGSAALVPFLRENLGSALAVLPVLGLAADPQTFRLPELRARCEQIHADPTVIIDGAHNADSLRRLVEALNCRRPGCGWTIVLGVVKGKDSPGVVRELLNLPGRFVLTNPRTHRPSDLDALQALLAAAGREAMVIPELRRRSQLPGGGPYLFTGSFFTALIGEELFGAPEQPQQ